jgi:uncharacterized protein (TIGR02284 family)
MNDAVSILKSLVRTTVDSAEGYALAGEHAGSHHLKNILNEAAARRLRMVAELNEELVRLGEEPEKNGSGPGALHHVWTRITESFRSGDAAAADRVEEGEDYIEAKFRKALTADDLAAETREVIARVHAQIVEGERMTDRLAEQYS